MNKITCKSDGEGGANITDANGRCFYAEATDLHEISQKIEAGATIQGALRQWIDSQLAAGDDEE